MINIKDDYSSRNTSQLSSSSENPYCFFVSTFLFSSISLELTISPSNSWVYCLLSSRSSSVGERPHIANARSS